MAFLTQSHITNLQFQSHCRALHCCSTGNARYTWIEWHVDRHQCIGFLQKNSSCQCADCRWNCALEHRDSNEFLGQPPGALPTRREGIGGNSVCTRSSRFARTWMNIQPHSLHILVVNAIDKKCIPTASTLETS